MFYINYGISKSGSTLTYELTYHLLNLAGHEQVILPAEIRADKDGKDHYTNAIRSWTTEVTTALEAANPPDRIQLLRTHGRATPSIRELIERGLAKHMVGIRDPRDVALSMLDVGDRKSKLGATNPNVTAGELESVFDVLGRNLDYCQSWGDIPGGLILDYEQTAFSPETTFDQICDQLGLGDVKHLYAQAIARADKKSEKLKNVARPHRHRREMSAEEQQRIIDRYPEFYARFYPDAKVIVEADDDEEAQAAVRERQAKFLERQLKVKEKRQAKGGAA